MLTRSLKQLLFCVIVMPAQIFAADGHALFSVEKPTPLQPVFVTVAGSVSAVRAGRERIEAEVSEDNAKTVVRIFPLAHFGRQAGEPMVLLLMDVPKAAAGKDILVFRRTGSAEREQLGKVQVKALEGAAKEACDLWDATDPFLLIAMCLERGKMEVDDVAQKALSRLAAQTVETIHRRTATYILGCREAERLEKQFNINGPVGAFRSCYPMLEAVSAERDDAISLDAQMRLLRAKAWSSDYNAAEAIARKVAANGLSEEYARMATRVAEVELPDLERERAPIQ